MLSFGATACFVCSLRRIVLVPWCCNVELYYIFGILNCNDESECTDWVSFVLGYTTEEEAQTADETIREKQSEGWRRAAWRRSSFASFRRVELDWMK